MCRAELKSMAKQQIKGNIGILFVIQIIIVAISGAAGAIFGFIPIAGSLIVSIIITPAFSLSLMRIYLNLTNAQKPEVKDTFSGFDDFWSAFKVNFLSTLFTTLWSLLLIIPGIIKSYSYSMSMFILAENKGMSALEAIRRSKEMMDGHKMDLFVLWLSFIGWYLLGIITLGIGFIWIAPYIYASTANFYNSIKPQSEVIVQDGGDPFESYGTDSAE